MNLLLLLSLPELAAVPVIMVGYTVQVLHPRLAPSIGLVPALAPLDSSCPCCGEETEIQIGGTPFCVYCESQR